MSVPGAKMLAGATRRRVSFLAGTLRQCGSCRSFRVLPGATVAKNLRRRLASFLTSLLTLDHENLHRHTRDMGRRTNATQYVVLPCSADVRFWAAVLRSLLALNGCAADFASGMAPSAQIRRSRPSTSTLRSWIGKGQRPDRAAGGHARSTIPGLRPRRRTGHCSGLRHRRA